MAKAKILKALRTPYTVMKSEDGKKVEVNLYGEVVESIPTDWWTGEKVDGLFIEGKRFLADLDALDEAEEVIFHINSVGGDVEMGISIYNRIMTMNAKTTTIVDGLAASAASIIAQAGDVRKISTGAQLMIHGASALLVGYYNAEEMKKTVNMLQSINKSVASVYASRSGAEEDHILNMMKAEKWFTAEEAVNEGLADEVTGTEPDVEMENVKDKADMLVVNGILQNMRGLPMPNFAARGTVVLSRGKEGTHDIELSQKTGEGRKETMTLKELKESQPELVEEIRNEATKDIQGSTDKAVADALDAERRRMMEIDSIAQAVGDSAMVNKAKYEEPMDAAQLALAAMKAQQAQGDTYLAARSKETEDAKGIIGTANSGMEDTVEADAAELAALVNYVKEGM